MADLSPEHLALIEHLLEREAILHHRPSDPSHPARQSDHYELAVAALAAVRGLR